MVELINYGKPNISFETVTLDYKDNVSYYKQTSQKLKKKN